jgi:hypothetical protein
LQKYDFMSKIQLVRLEEFVKDFYI